MVRFFAQILLIIVVFTAAWLRGGKPERYVASTYFAMLFVSSANALLGEAGNDTDYQGLHSVHFVLDACALAVIVFVALRYDRWWTLWVGSVQFIAFMAHVLKASGLPVPPMAYAVMERWPVWLAVAITGVGTYLHCRQFKASVSDT